MKNKIISKAIEDAYKGFLMQHNFPFASLQIEMTGNDLDVNVHPAKMEVRFSRGDEVYKAIYEAILQTSKKKEMIPEVRADQGREAKEERPKMKSGQIPEPFEYKERQRLREQTIYEEDRQQKNRWELLEQRMEGKKFRYPKTCTQD